MKWTCAQFCTMKIFSYSKCFFLSCSPSSFGRKSRMDFDARVRLIMTSNGQRTCLGCGGRIRQTQLCNIGSTHPPTAANFTLLSRIPSQVYSTFNSNRFQKLQTKTFKSGLWSGNKFSCSVGKMSFSLNSIAWNVFFFDSCVKCKKFAVSDIQYIRRRIACAVRAARCRRQTFANLHCSPHSCRSDRRLHRMIWHYSGAFWKWIND